MNLKNQQANESVMDEYDSNMDKDPFKGAGIGKGDTDKQAVTELTIWPQVCFVKNIAPGAGQDRDYKHLTNLIQMAELFGHTGFLRQSR